MSYEVGDYVITSESRDDWVYKSRIIGINDEENLVEVVDLWSYHIKVNTVTQETDTNGCQISMNDVIQKVPKNFRLRNVKQTHPEVFL